MAKTKEQKKAIVDKLEGGLKTAPSAVFVGFSGVKVGDETAMRRDLRGAGVSYTVAKKTLIRRALELIGFAHDTLQLDGEVAVAYGNADADSTAPARLVHEFGKKLGGSLKILGGIFEGKLMSASEMQGIATIPPLETLRAMFAQIVNSPRQRFAVVLGKVAETKN